MKNGENITKQELETLLGQLRMVFDIVRVVDPYNVQVLSDNAQEISASESCFGVWKKQTRCKNCISIKAYTDFCRKSKYEFQERKAFSVIAMPFRLIDDHNKLIIVEMVNQVSDEMQVKLVGQEIIARTMEENDRKLYTDSLTGIFNRRYFDENLFIYETKTTLSRKMAFLLFDIRHFKKINDTYGHLMGDIVLKEVARIMNQYTRKEEPCIRIGGDEFMVVLQGQEEEVAKNTIDRIKAKVRDLKVVGMENEVIEINAGYSYTDSFDASRKFIDELERQADEKMYEDKKMNLHH